MPLKTPAFWFQKKGVASTLLTPISWLYQAGHKINQSINNTPYTSSLPVICVGNAIAGGSGKTPTVITLAKILKEHNPVVITRGYGGSTTHATIVDTTKHTAEDVGDEALLISRHVPTIVCRNRAEGAQLAEQNNFGLILMDDGLQNNSLTKTLSFLVVDRQLDFGNNKTIPAGPLREPLKNILDKSDTVICIGRPFQSDLPVFESSIKAQTTLDPSKNYIAFAGIGIPDKFKNTLLDLNINLVGWYPFADHHAYTKNDIDNLEKQAKEKNADLVTTEKDHVRLPKDKHQSIKTLPIDLKFKDSPALIDFIENKIALKSPDAYKNEVATS